MRGLGLLLALAALVGCARHVVVDRDAAIRGLGDPDWTIRSEPPAPQTEPLNQEDEASSP